MNILLSILLGGFFIVNNPINEKTKTDYNKKTNFNDFDDLQLKNQLLDAANDSIFLHDFQGNFIFINEAACKIHGYTKNELMSLNLHDLDVPEYSKLIEPRVEDLMKFGELTFETAHYHKDRSIIPLEIHARILDIGEDQLILSVARDITERKNYEEKLELDVKKRTLKLEELNKKLQRREKLTKDLSELKKQLLSPQKLDKKLKIITDGIVKIFYADFARIWLIDKSDLCKSGCIHAEIEEGPDVCLNRTSCLHLKASSGRYNHLDGDHSRVPIGSYKIGRIASGVDFKFVTNDVIHDPRVHDHQWARELGFISFAGFKLSSKGGKPIGVLALFKKAPLDHDSEMLLEDLANTTSQVILAGQAEMLLEESEEKYFNLFENAPMAIFRSRIDGSAILDANQKLGELFESSKEELIKNPATIRWADKNLRKKMVSEVKEKGFLNDFEIPIITRNGKIKTTLCSIKIYPEKDYLEGSAVDITDRKRMEKALIESEKRFRTFFDLSIDLVCISGIDSYFRRINSSWERTMGYSKEELLSKPFIEFVHPDDKEKTLKLLDNKIKKGEVVFSFENRYIKKDGGIVWLEWTAQPNLDKKTVFSIARDVTERKIFENKLKEREEHLRLITDNMNDVIGQMDINGIVTYASPSLEQLSGFKPSDLIGKINFDFIHPQDQTFVMQAFQESISTKAPITVEYRVKKSDGAYLWVETSGMPVYDNMGNFESAVFTIRDLSERKKIEMALKDSEKSLNAFINAITEAAFMIDVQGNYLIVNDSLVNRLGKSKEELIGANAFDLLPEKLSKTRRRRVEKILKTGDVQIFPDERDGIYLNNHIYPIKNDQGIITRLVIISMDVTELKIAEKALKESEERYRGLIESSPDFILIYDNTGIIYTNPAAIKVFKAKDKDEMIGLHLDDFVYPEYQAELDERRLNAQEHGKKNDTIESKVFNLKGKLIDVETASVPIVYGGKKAVQIVGRDITARKKAEKALQDSKEFNDSIISSMMDGFSVLDSQGVHINVNNALCEMTGFSRDELLGVGPPHPYWPQEEYKKIKNALNETIMGNLKEFELIFKTKSGERFPVMVSPSQILDEEGNLISAFASVKDISERKIREKQINLHNKLLEGINRIFEKTITTDTEDELAIESLKVCEEITNSKFGFILELNKRGKLDTLAISDPGWDECTMEDAVIMIKDMEERGIHGKASKEGVSVLTNDPSKHQDSVGTPPGHPPIETFLGVPLKQGGRIIGSIGLGNKEDGYNLEDKETLEKLSVAISESLMRKRAENSLKVALEEKELLIKEIHHRVKNNLMVISSLLNLQSEYIKDKAALEVFKESQNRAQSMALIHERLYQSTDLKRINFGEYITSLTNDLFQTYVTDTSRITLQMKIDDIMVDINTAVPLGLILNELVTNSMKYAFPNGINGIIVIEFYKLLDELVLIISDNGVGFPAGFEYENTDSLGLQLVTSLTSQIDGEIQLDKQDGTKFTIKFREKFN